MKGLTERLSRIPLHIRLSVRFATLFTVLLALLLLALAVTRHATAERAFDARLLRVALELGRAAPWTDTAVHATVEREREVLFATVNDERGPVVQSGPAEALDVDLSPADPLTPRFTDVDLGQAADPYDTDRVVRALALHVLTIEGVPATVHVVARGTGAGRHWQAVLDRLAVVLPLGFLAAALATARLVRTALLPLREVTAAAGDLTAATLDEPIEVEGAEGEVVRLQDALNATMARLDDSFRSQQRFISNVSHELKTPLAVLLTSAQMLDARAAERDEIDEFRRGVETEARRLGAMVESFLSLARVDHGAQLARRETVSMTEVVMESVAHCTRAAKLHGVRLVPQVQLRADGTAPTVRGDQTLLRSMLDNLIRNACRFSPRDAAVRIELTTTDTDCVLLVSDEGPGVPDAVREELFQPFVQAEGDSPRSSTFGLGLTIARDVAEVHGGTIAVRNLDEGGCEFRIDLPLGRSAPSV